MCFLIILSLVLQCLFCPGLLFASRRAVFCFLLVFLVMYIHALLSWNIYKNKTKKKGQNKRVTLFFPFWLLTDTPVYRRSLILLQRNLSHLLLFCFNKKDRKNWRLDCIFVFYSSILDQQEKLEKSKMQFGDVGSCNLIQMCYCTRGISSSKERETQMKYGRHTYIKLSFYHLSEFAMYNLTNAVLCIDWQKKEKIRFHLKKFHLEFSFQICLFYVKSKKI